MHSGTSSSSASNMMPPPTLKIVLVGSNWVKNNQVGNFLLGRDVFQKDPSKIHNAVCTGLVHDSFITVAITADLFTTDLSDQDVKEKVNECVSLCAPHALVLVVDPKDFDREKRQRMEHIVTSFSKHAFEHSIVFPLSKDQNTEIKTIIEVCGRRTYQFKKKDENDRLGALKAIKYMILGRAWSFVTYDKNKESTKTPGPSTERSSRCNIDLKLNLVLCGSNAAAKASAAALILGLGDQTEHSPVCGKGVAEVCGHHVTLVQLPSLAITQFCKEDVLAVQQCVRLCDSGVDAFLLVVPRGPLSDEDKEELRRMEHFFGEEVRRYCHIVVTSEGEKDAEGIEDIVKAGEGMTEIPKVPYHILDKNLTVQQLLEKVEKIRKENDPGCYTTDMFITAQLRIHLNYHIQLNEICSRRGCNQGLKEMTGDLRIVLLGKTGQGKSATGNTILGGSKFDTLLAANSVTHVCQKETAMVNGRRITVIDTPGLFDTACDNENTRKEIRKCIGMAAPGPHVFILVIALTRFTQEMRDAVKIIQEMFGEEADKYILVLFTRADDLEGKPLDEYIQNDSNIKTLLQKCGKRYLAFNNRDKSSNDQVPKLLDMMSTMLRVNGGKCYTSEMFQKAEEALKQKQDRILKEREEELKKEKEELQAKHEAAMKELKQGMEEERRRREEEIKRNEQSMLEKMKTLEEEEKRRRCAMEEEYKDQKKQNEDWIQHRIEEIQLEKQRQQKEWERRMQQEQRKREEEEECRNIKEKELQERQRKEKENFENEKQKMERRAEEEKRKKQQEYEDRVKKEEEKRKDLEEKIKNAEEGRVKDLEEQKRKHEEECQRKHEEEKKRKEEEQEELKRRVEINENMWLEKQEQHRQEQERYEKQRQVEKQQRDAKDELRRKEEGEERRKIEQDAALKMKDKEDEMREIEQEYAAKLKEEETKAAQQKAEMEEQLRKQREQFKEQIEKEATASEESERRNMEFLKEVHEKEKDLLKRETELAARKQAEKEFNEELDRTLTKAHEEGYEKGKEEVEAERTRVGKCVDGVINALSGKSDKKK